MVPNARFISKDTLRFLQNVTGSSRAARNPAISRNTAVQCLSRHNNPKCQRIQQQRHISSTRSLKFQDSSALKAPTAPTAAETVSALLRDGLSPTATHYDLFPQSVPLGPPPKGPFLINLPSLKREFLQLQARAHPDLHPEGQRPRAAAVSARVNEAYRTLEDPLRRAQYLLDLSGHSRGGSNDESTLMDEEDMLLEVMEARERAEEAGDDAEQIQILREENQERIENAIQNLEESFAKGDLDTAARDCARLRYWVGVEDRLRTGSSMH